VTDCQTDPGSLPVGNDERIERSLMFPLVARVVLVLVVFALVIFLFRWSSAVKRDTVIVPQGQHVPDEWKVVIPDYAGTGRGAGITSVKPWRFGTMADHPIAVTLCVAAAVLAAGAFVACSFYASRLKGLNQSGAAVTTAP
jgi:hypothetical protein